MEKETLKLNIDAAAVRAYYDDKMACDEQKRLLELLFGKDQLQPTQSKDVTERVKTFVDAVNELGNDNSLVQQYNMLYSEFGSTLDADIIAYLKLRIITAALNEGWEPQFTENEYRYYPYFYLNAYGDLVFALADSVSAYSNTCNGARLAFRTRELAAYAGKQFANIWADFQKKVGSDSQSENE